jgi:hypothetical protein
LPVETAIIAHAIHRWNNDLETPFFEIMDRFLKVIYLKADVMKSSPSLLQKITDR